MKPISRGILIGSLVYLAAGLATAAYAVSEGLSTGSSFDGVTGNEPPALKMAECVFLWPYALATLLTK